MFTDYFTMQSNINSPKLLTEAESFGNIFFLVSVTFCQPISPEGDTFVCLFFPLYDIYETQNAERTGQVFENVNFMRYERRRDAGREKNAFPKLSNPTEYESFLHKHPAKRATG